MFFNAVFVGVVLPLRKPFKQRGVGCFELIDHVLLVCQALRRNGQAAGRGSPGFMDLRTAFLGAEGVHDGLVGTERLACRLGPQNGGRRIANAVPAQFASRPTANDGHDRVDVCGCQVLSQGLLPIDGSFQKEGLHRLFLPSRLVPPFPVSPDASD